MYQVGELFAGIGGIGLAFSRAGFELTWANEVDEQAGITYEANFKSQLLKSDLRKLNTLNLKTVTVLTAGFPCQSFSIAGLKEGFKDKRGTLFFEILRMIRDLKPRAIFLENVKNLLTHDNGVTFQVIKSELEAVGMFLKYKILNTCEYSQLPQNRERVYIIGFKGRDDWERFEFPAPEPKLLPLSELLEPETAEGFYYHRSQYYQKLKKMMNKREVIYQWRRGEVRENRWGLCPTLTASMGTGGHNVPLVVDKKGIRKLTPRECARLQGFPESFILPSGVPILSLYQQIGNSVSVPVVEAVAKKMKLAMR
jgi:DNA (cytosine-5)-methyltransferase 1